MTKRSSVVLAPLVPLVFAACAPRRPAAITLLDGRPGVVIENILIAPALPVVQQPASLAINIRNDRGNNYPKITYAISVQPAAAIVFDKGTCGASVPAGGQCGDAYFLTPAQPGPHTVTVTLDSHFRDRNPETWQKAAGVDVVPPPPENAAVDILAPRGGEAWRRGNLARIEWRTNAPKVGIWLAHKSAPMELLANDLPGGAGFFDWPIPAGLALDGGYTIQVAVYRPDGRAVQTFSESLPFSIIADNKITVLTPRPGERWTAGQEGDVLISWEGPCDQSNVQIDLMKSGEKIQTLVRPLSLPPESDCAPGERTIFQAFGTSPPAWIAPGEDYSVHIGVPDGSVVGDSAPFAVDAPVDATPSDVYYPASNPGAPIRILKPGAADIWQAGQQEQVPLEFEGPCRQDNVRIELRRGNALVRVLREAQNVGSAQRDCDEPLEVFRTSAYGPSSALEPGPGYFIRVRSSDGAAGDGDPFMIMPPARVGGVVPAGFPPDSATP